MATHIYRARHQRQTRRFQGKLIGCTETSFAVFADAVTLGGVKVTEAIVRAMSSEPDPNPSSPGLNIPQIAAVARQLHIEFDNRTGDARHDLQHALNQGRRAVVQLWYSDIGGGDIGHALEIEARRARPGGISGFEMLVNDPIKTTRQWIDEDHVFRAMAHWAAKIGLAGDALAFGTGRIVPELPGRA